MTTIKEFANKLNNRQYRSEITEEEIREAKKLGFVVMFGASDDLFVVEGAISDEFEAFGGKDFFFSEGQCVDSDTRRALQKFQQDEDLVKVEVRWCPKEIDCSWLITPRDVLYESFDILEDGELFCCGAVVDIKSLGGKV